MADEDKVKVRAKLVVTSVATARPIGEDNVVLDFKAHVEGQEEEKGYETWGKVFVDLVKTEAILDCEITDIQKGDQTRHRVTQMFDSAGKPIRPPRGGGGGGGKGYYGKNPESVAIERASIEATNAVIFVGELLKAGKIELTHTQAVTALNWAEKKMRANMNPAAFVQPKPEEKQQPVKPAEKPVTPAPAPAPAPAQPVLEPEKPDTGGKLTEATRHKIADIVAERKYDPGVIQSHILRVYKVNNSRDLTEKQGLELLAWVDKGEIEPGKEIPKIKEG